MSDSMDITPDDVAAVSSSDLILPAEPELVVPDSAEQAALDLAKLKCVEGESPEEHETHREELAQAYAAFAARAGGVQNSNSAEPGTTVPLTADVSMHLEG